MRIADSWGISGALAALSNHHSERPTRHRSEKVTRYAIAQTGVDGPGGCDGRDGLGLDWPSAASRRARKNDSARSRTAILDHGCSRLEIFTHDAGLGPQCV